MWLARLGREHDNLRTALAWAISLQEAEVAVRLGFALEVFWWIRGYQHEGRRWMDQVMVMRDRLSLHLQSRALMAASTTAYGEGDADVIDGLRRGDYWICPGNSGETPMRKHSHGRCLGFWRRSEGTTSARRRTSRGRCRSSARRATRAWRRRHTAGSARCSSSRATIAGRGGGSTRGWRMVADLGIGSGSATPSLTLGNSRCLVASTVRQLSWFEQGIQPSCEMGDRPNVAYILEGLGVVAGLQGAADRAARLLGAADGLIEAVGVRGHTYYLPYRSRYERAIAAVRAQLGEQAFEAARAEGRGMTFEWAVAYALQGDDAPDG